MFHNYIKMTFRNLRKYKVFSSINIIGLVIGMTCFILIMLFVHFELGYDNFHENRDTIYRIACQLPGEKYGMTSDKMAITPAPLASALMETFPEVEYATRLNRAEHLLITKDETNFFENGIFADEHFFDVFSFELKKGDKKKVLENLQNIVISQRIAHKFFGDNDPLGKTLSCYLGDFTVTGILKNVPENSHIRFDWIIPFAAQFPPKKREQRLNRWNWDNYYTYVKMKTNSGDTGFENKLNAFTKTKYIQWEVRKYIRYFLQPLDRVHLTGGYRYEIDATTDISVIRLFVTIAFFVLLIACINAVNLSTANASKRAREVGIRKVVGSGRWQLLGQFTGDSLIISLISLIIAIGLTELLLPGYNRLIQKTIGLQAFLNMPGILSLIGIIVATGLLSGLYPALVLSSMKPVKVLIHKTSDPANRLSFRNILVLFQFSVAIILMIASLIIFRQINYIKNKDLGFNREQVLVMNRSDPGLRKNFDVFKNKLLQTPGVVDVTTSSQLPTHIESATGINFQKDDGEEILVHYQFIGVDYNFIDMFDMEMVQGRNFSKRYGTDSENALIVNEAFVRSIGWENPVGKLVPQVWSGNDDQKYTIVGVVKDFHARPLRQEIKPVIIRCQPNSYWVHIHIRPGDMETTLANIENTYNGYHTRYPFNYFFLDERFNQMYNSEKLLGQLVTYANGLAIFIACLGILGLAVYTAEKKTKEIGIRKVLGATVSGIVLFMSKDFIKWVLIANLFAWPIAYYAMNRWLQNFAYHIDPGWWTFLLAGLIALAIAIFTISFQAIKSAMANPVDTLRYE